MEALKTNPSDQLDKYLLKEEKHSIQDVISQTVDKIIDKCHFPLKSKE